MEVLKAWARVPVLALRALAEILLSVVRMIARLFGMRAPAPLAPLPLPDVSANEVKADLQDGIQRALTGEPRKPCFEPGHAVHAYASASAEARQNVDVSALSPAQIAWLVTLTDADLEKLHKAGPAACQRAADGKKCGIVGLKVPGTAFDEDPEEARLERIRAALRERNFGFRRGSPFPTF